MGAIDGEQQDQFGDAIADCAGPRVSTVVLDLSGVTFLGSSGLAALIWARASLNKRAVPLCIDECSDLVARVLDITDLRDSFRHSPPLLAATAHRPTYQPAHA